MLELIVVRDTLQLSPHKHPPIFLDKSELINHVARPKGFFHREEKGELTVINLILEWQLNLVTHNHRDTMTYNGVKQAARRGSVTSRVQAEL